MTQAAIKRAGVSMATVFVALMLMVVGAGWSMYNQAQGERWVRHTADVQLMLQTARSDLLWATLLQRSYLLTHDERFATDFEGAIATADRHMRRVGQLTRDDPRQAAALKRLRLLAAERAAIARLAMKQGRAGAPRGEIMRRLQNGPPSGAELMAQFAAMDAEERRLLDARATQVTDERILTFAALAGLAAILLGAAYHVYRVFSARVGELHAHEMALMDANRRLQDEAERREEVESQVRQLQKMESLGQLTGGIAHDFNNMLAIVMGSLEMARRRLARGQTDRVEDAIGHAMEGAQAAAQLTRRLLAFSRGEALKPQLLDPNTFLVGMTEMLRRTLGESVRVETELDPAVTRVCVDPAQLESAIVNIAINARDAMAGGGKLCIQSGMTEIGPADPALPAGTYVAICLSDSGAGIPQEIIHRIFDPFFTTKGPGKGTGLGLAQVYAFARQSGGAVKVDSEPGRGTKVSLYLPKHDGDARQAETPEAAMPGARNSEIVLLVEDNAQVREVTVDQLRELGYTVVPAENAQDALAQLAVQPKVDLLFTDVVMPDMDGRQLCEVVCERRPEVKVLFTTGYAAEVDLGPGAQVLRKPFSQEQLAARVREVLDARATAEGAVSPVNST